MTLLATVQEIILKKSIDDIVYEPGIKFDKSQSKLPDSIGINHWDVLSAPPDNSSRNTYKDLQEVLLLANNRTSKDIELVYLIDDNPINIFLPFISQHNLSFPQSLFDRMYEILSLIILDLKYYFNRPRPQQLAQFYGEEINIIHTKTHQTPSYPSGHVSYAMLLALILIDAYPMYKNQLLNFVDITGQARILQGVHFRSDNDAAKKMVSVVYPKLKNLILRENISV